MALKEKENLLVGVIMGSFLPSPQKTELIEIVRNAAAKEREPETRGEQLRAMSDEQLAVALYENADCVWCGNLAECGSVIDAGEEIPVDKCVACVLKWLQQPAEEGRK